MRRIKVNDAWNLLWLKMRPDTPQRYEYIAIEEIEGSVCRFINIHPRTQLYDLKDRKECAEHITMKNCNCECQIYFDVEADEKQYALYDFTFENLKIKAKKNSFDEGAANNITVKNVVEA